MSTILQGSGLTRSFGNFVAVDGVDLTLETGRITGLIGPNGAGKTTLMLMLAGMLSPHRGKVTVGDFDFAKTPRAARSLIGWLPDSFGSWGELKVKEIMLHFASLYGISKAEAKTRTENLLQEVHLEDMAEKYAHVLSRGQKQRLGVARTLLHQPKVLLLDEPAAGMDPRSRLELRELLRRVADGGASVLISSHVLSELEDTIDDAIFMSEGHVVDVSQLQGSTKSTLRYRLSVLDSAAFSAFLNGTGVGTFVPAGSLDYEVEVNSLAAAADLLARVVGAGVKVSGFTLLAEDAKPTLEQIYLQVDKGERK